jgi:two-component system OmpR family sensor kinase
MRSLRTQLWMWMLCLLTSVGLVASGIFYWEVRDEAQGFFDQQLRLIALNVDATGKNRASSANDASSHDPEDDFVVQIWDEAGNPVPTMAPGPAIPRGSATGFRNVTTDSGAWRCYTLVTGNSTIQASQQSVVREEMASDAAWRSLSPIAVSIPLSWLVLSLVINRVLGGLDGLARGLVKRRPLNRGPIPTENLPTEVQPLVAAMNEALKRLQDALSAQGRFVSDAAHALRTPLAALQLQVGNLRNVAEGQESARRVEELDLGVKRAIELARQLLLLARGRERGRGAPTGPVDLGDQAKSAIAELLPLSDHRRQDVGLVRCDSGLVMADAEDLRVLTNNLLDNAIRYTPIGGTIDISISASDSEMELQIRDSGPGIPEDQLDLVFEPFHRSPNPTVEGSGLGLSIVRGIAERYGAKVILSNRNDRSGLIASVALSRHFSVTEPSFAPQS